MAYEDSDKRRFHVPCTECNEYQHLKWSQVSWQEDKPDTAVYACEHCGAALEDKNKIKMLLAGKWVAEKETKKTAGFHLNELYSPWRTWAEVAEDFIFAKKSPETLKTWVNTSLGETWEDQGEGIEDGQLMPRAENYGVDSIPEEVRLLTAGVDVQQDRLEIQIVGWGINNHSWIIDHQILWGDPVMPEVWNELDIVLTNNYDGLRIAGCCVDSGFLTDQVYQFTKPRQARRVFSIKGVAGSGKAVASKPTQAGRNRTTLYSLGVDTIKDAIYSRLKITSGDGQVHFSTDLDPEFYAQLTAEKVVIKYYKGFPRREWVKTRDRNEALDCFGYAFASYHILNPAIDKLKTRKESQQKKEEEVDDKTFDLPLDKPKRKATRPRRRGGFVNRW
jgi:phage terminase large subunit GpA-like protein